ncbi:MULTISPECIES: hypothetical protein [Burkholderiaceae]|nr:MULTISPECIES: hypothetical protein [Burkholderiaceae]SAL57594.1 hypothetical protein AWB71_03134 [Caballeronia peredens]
MSQSDRRNTPAKPTAQDTLAFKYIDSLVEKQGSNATGNRRLELRLKQDATFTAIDFTLAKRR